MRAWMVYLLALVVIAVLAAFAVAIFIGDDDDPGRQDQAALAPDPAA